MFDNLRSQRFFSDVRVVFDAESDSSGSFLYDFCGQEFFNVTLLDGDWPQFTLCFQVTILNWAPAALLAIFLIPYLYGTLSETRQRKTLKPSWMYYTKLFLSTLLAILAFADSGQSGSPYNEYQAFILGPLIRGIALTVTCFMLELDRCHARHNNGYLCVFWLIHVFCGIIPFYSEAKEQAFSDYWHVSFYIQFTLWFVQLILSNFSEKMEILPEMISEKHPNPCPVNFAPFFAYTTFQWLDPLMWRGWRKYVAEEDLWEINPENKVDPLFKRFNDLYMKEREKQDRKKREWQAKMEEEARREPARHQNGYMNLQEDTPPETETSREKKAKLGKSSTKTFRPSVFMVLFKQFGPQILKAAMFKFAYDCLQFCNPQVLNLLIDFTKDDSEPIWKGIVYSCAFFLIAVLSSQFFHQLFFIGMTCGMNMKSAIIAAVYRKALTMSNEAKRGSTVGEIVNLMAIDSDRINLAIGYLWVLWSAPFQITLALIFLWFQVQEAVFGGLLVIAISFPVNFFIAKIQRSYQVGQLLYKDKRIRQMGEILNGIKVIKLYAWEFPFLKRIFGTRKKEVDYLYKAAYLNGVNTFTFTLLPFLVSLVTFLVYVYGMGKPLTSNKAFVTLSLFNILRAPLNMLPMLIAFLVQASVSLERITKFLDNTDLDLTAVEHEPDDEYPLKMTNCDLTWINEEDSEGNVPRTLKDVSFKVKTGSLTAIVGPVGAGKSSLVSSFLGDLAKLKGTINVHGDLAYVSQQAWIQNLTLRQNILFGKRFREQKYRRVIEACALKPDLEILPGGDQTEIGEKGINLSGGQKQRVNIARAVYQNSDIYLFDDPLSAVDAHVGKHLFDEVIGPDGILQSKTRVLVTHGLAFLKHVDHVVFMKDGKIVNQGSFLDLLENCDEFKEFFKSANLTDEDLASLDLEESDVDKKGSRSPSVGSYDIEREKSPVHVFKKDRDHGPRRGRLGSVAGRISLLDEELADLKDVTDMDRELDEANEEDIQKENEGRLTAKEVAEEGNIKLSVFANYIKSIGVPAFCISFSLFIMYQCSTVFAQIWLSSWSDWTDDQLSKNASVTGSKLNEYTIVYGISGLCQTGFILGYALTFCVALVSASVKLHRGLLNNIMRCAMSFFDQVPGGRILNRFSKDVETTDNTLPQAVRQFAMTMFTVLQTFIIITYTTPIFLVVLLPLTVFYYFVQRFYVRTSRQLKRVESTTRSPIFNHFSETLTGTSVVRAYQAQDRFILENCKRVNENNIYYFSGTVVAARWLGIRLEFLGAIIVFAASLLTVLSRDSLQSGLVGLAVSSSLSVTSALNWSVRMMSDLETYIVSVERIREYAELENEAAWEVEEKKPASDWPQQGEVTFKHYSTRYRKDLDLVLKGISCSISPGERVGIVGRTGAGKSSLTLALFRIIEPSGGSIEIDNVSIAELGLHDLRSKLTILPQDPVLFSGSLRENIDPFEHYSEADIWDSLKNAHLEKFARERPEGLEYDVGEGGLNLSVGQRQLVCLARALLHKTLILILDEATAAVDLQTDSLIQDTIREEFKGCTILTIAHRLNTIMDYDRVMVLSDGLIKEFDNPRTLRDDPTTQFHSMAADAGLLSEEQTGAPSLGSSSSGIGNSPIGVSGPGSEVSVTGRE